MKVHLTEIPTQGLKLELTADNKDLSKLDDQTVVKLFKLEAKLVRMGAEVKLSGEYKADIDLTCDRCLIHYPLKLEESINITLIPLGIAPPVADSGMVSLDSAGLDYFEGQELNLLGYYEDQLLMDLPIKKLCDPSCKGLCPVCGADQNKEGCDCDKTDRNNPFAALKDLLPDIK